MAEKDRDTDAPRVEDDPLTAILLQLYDATLVSLYYLTAGRWPFGWGDPIDWWRLRSKPDPPAHERPER